jgi:hypothetical protein
VLPFGVACPRGKQYRGGRGEDDGRKRQPDKNRLVRENQFI